MEKKTFLNSIAMILILSSYFACGPTKSNGSNYIGKWVDDRHEGSVDFLGTGITIEAIDSNYIIEIYKQGENFLVRNKMRRDGGFEGIYTLTKDNNLVGLNGMATIAYDKESKSLFISARGGPIENWIRLKEK